MHDLVQLMGKDIVNQECRDDPGKRSRLWLFEDVLDILSEDTGTNAVKAIVLDLPAPEKMTISLDAFTNMKMLRMFILHDVLISSQGPIRIHNKLRWLEWSNAPDLQFGSGPKKLVRLDVKKSHIRQLGGNFQNFRKLKSISFSQCMSLACVLDLSLVPNLESLNLDGCQGLVEVHQSVGCLDKLKFLSLDWCSNLSIFPNTLQTKSLQTLSLSGCFKLEKFPDILGKMEHLEYLDLQGMAIKELPASIENLVSVKRIGLQYCENLARLPSSIYKLKNLESLSLEECSNFVMFPKNLKDSTSPDGNMGFQNLDELRLSGCNLSEVEFLKSSSDFPKLAYLYLSNNKFTHLPTCINKFDYWTDFFVHKRKQLQENPQLPSNTCIVEANSCNSLQKLPDLSSLPSNCLEANLSSCCDKKGRDVSSLEELSKRSKVDILLSGREMPEWILHCEKGFISFMVPQDLYDKFLGLALCFVLGPEEGEVVDHASYVVNILVNNVPGMSQHAMYFCPLESDHVWLIYFPRSTLIGGRDYQRKDWNHFQVCHDLPEGSLKKCGFRLICEQQEDDLKVVLQHHSAGRNKLGFRGKKIVKVKQM